MKKFVSIISISIFALFIAIIMVLNGCATIINGNKQDVKVRSTPDEAKVIINGIERGLTPGVFRLKRGEKYFIEVQKEGYQTFKLVTSKEISGWVCGNLLCGGLIGLVIDFASGNAYDIDPDNIHVTLQKSTSSLELYLPQDFGSIDLTDESGNSLARIEVIWE